MARHLSLLLFLKCYNKEDNNYSAPARVIEYIMQLFSSSFAEPHAVARGTRTLNNFKHLDNVFVQL